MCVQVWGGVGLCVLHGAYVFVWVVNMGVPCVDYVHVYHMWAVDMCA